MIELYLDMINDKSCTWNEGRHCDCDICQTDIS